jgi:hypothetical protein
MEDNSVARWWLPTARPRNDDEVHEPTENDPAPHPMLRGLLAVSLRTETQKAIALMGQSYKEAVMRQTGSRNTLVKVDYDLIGDLAGIAGDTAKQYAHRGEYDPRSLDSVLRWVNGRRVAKGLPLIGMPSETHPEAETGCTVPFLPAPQNGLLRYDPMTGSYQTQIMGNTAFRR